MDLQNYPKEEQQENQVRPVQENALEQSHETAVPGQPGPAVGRFPKKRIALAGVAVLLTAACVVAFALPKNTEQTAFAYKESKVARGDITAGISETGTISIGFETVKYDISASKMEDLGLSVKVQEVYVKSGQKVSEGDPLILISTADLQEQLSSAKITLQQAQASLTEAELNRTLKKIQADSDYETNQILGETATLQYDLTIAELENEIQTLTDEVEDLQIKLKFLRSYLGDQSYFDDHVDENPTDLNFEGWYTNGNTALPDDSTVRRKITSYNNELEQAQSDLEQAELLLETKQKQAENTLQSEQFTSENAQTLYQVALAQIENDVATAQLKVESAQNDVDQFSEYLANDGIITSPITGTIMTLGYSAGDELSSSSAIAIISNPQEAAISVSIVQEDITSLELGQTASITLDAFPDQVFTGKLDSMSVSPSRSGGSTVSYTVDSTFDTPSDKFFEGMTGDVTFITTQLTDVLTVSNRAVSNVNGVQTVKVKADDGTVEEREITTGFSDGRNVEVLSGLEEGEIVLIESQVAAQ